MAAPYYPGAGKKASPRSAMKHTDGSQEAEATEPELRSASSYHIRPG